MSKGCLIVFVILCLLGAWISFLVHQLTTILAP